MTQWENIQQHTASFRLSNTQQGKLGMHNVLFWLCSKRTKLQPAKPLLCSKKTFLQMD